MRPLAPLSRTSAGRRARQVDSNFDDPRLTDYDTLTKNLEDLRAGRSTEIPIYDFKTSKRVGYRTQEPPESRIVCLEGIYALSSRLHKSLDLRVSVSGGVHFDLVKRVMRDVHRSGQDPEGIVQQITETVYPMYKAFIEPDLQTAHIRITNNFNPFSGLQKPTYILKSVAHVPEEDARRVLKTVGQEIETTTTDLYDIYLLPPGEDPDMCQTWLRMRNTDGRYSLIFEEWVTDGPFIIAPRITFEVNVRILGGLMALGYEIAVIMKRTSTTLATDDIQIKYDVIDGLEGRVYVQVQGMDRALVDKVATSLNMQGGYVPRSYIEEVQAESLTHDFQERTSEELRKGTGLAQQAGLVGIPRVLHGEIRDGAGGVMPHEAPGMGVEQQSPAPGLTRLKSSSSFVKMPAASMGVHAAHSRASSVANVGYDAATGSGVGADWEQALGAATHAATEVASRQRELGGLLQRLTRAVEAVEQSSRAYAAKAPAAPPWWVQAAIMPIISAASAAVAAVVLARRSRQ